MIDLYMACAYFNMTITLVWYLKIISEGPYKKAAWVDIKYGIIDAIVTAAGPLGSIGIFIAIYAEVRTWRKLRGWRMNVNDPKWQPALSRARAQFEVWEASAKKNVN